MANQNTTFHAKITADARQFIEQVESASQSLQQLIDVYGQVSNQAKGSATKAATNETAAAQKDVKDIFSVAKKEQEALHQAAMQNEQELASFRKRERQIAESAFRDQNRLQDLQEQVGIRGNIAPGPIRESTEGIRDIKNLQEIQRRGNAQIAKEQRNHIAQERQEQKLLAAEKREAAAKLAKEERAQVAEQKRQEREFGAVKRQLAKEERDLATQIATQNRRTLDAMVTGRYALYDMANAYRGVYDVAQRVTSQLLTTVQAAADFESSFTAAERALKLESGSQAFVDLRQNLIELSREIPVTFDQLSQIAALGGQMGIANEDVEDFTNTVAAFTAATGVSAEESAAKFGRIASLLGVPVAEFEKLGSAIVFAGFNAVATESEILTMTQSIASSASRVGFAADETVGLATALASLGLAPELSRGALQRIFGEIDQAVLGTSGYLDDFARVMGTTEDQIAFMWQEDPSQFFLDLNKALAESGDLGEGLRSLGIVNIRDVELMTRLAQGTDIYNKSLDDAINSYEQGTALSTIYGKSADDLNSSFIRLGNAFSALQAALGSGLAEALKPVLEIVIDLIASATEFAGSPLGKAIVPITAALAAAVAAFAGFNFIVNIATAQVLAMRTAQIKMTEMNGTATLGLRALYNQLVGNVYIYTSATGAIQFLTKSQLEAGIAAGTLNKELAEQALAAGSATAATQGLSKSLKVFGVVGAVTTVLTLGSMILDATGAMDIFKDGTDEASEKLRQLGQDGIAAAGGLKVFQDAMAADAESARVSSLSELEDAQGKVNTALQAGIDLYSDYDTATSDGSDIDLDVAAQKGAEYRKVLAETLLAPPEGGGASFVDNFLGLDAQTEGILTDIGFDYLEMIDAAFAEGADGKGAENYVKAYQEAFRMLESGEIVGTLGLSYAETIGESLIAQFGPEIGEPLAQRIRDLAIRLRQEGVGIEELSGILSGLDFSVFLSGAQNIDATNTEVDRQIQAQADLESRLANTSGEVENTAGKYEELNKQMQEYIGLVGIVESGNQKVFSAFGALALGVDETKEGFTGLGEAAASNLSNLQSFISAAFTSSFAEGTGVVGGLERVSAAIYVLGQQGADTTEIWELTRSLFVSALTSMGGQYAVLAAQLSVAPDFKTAEKFISGFISMADTSGQLTPALIANLNALRNAMAGETDYVAEFQNAFSSALSSVRQSSSKTRTELEKLQDTIKETFKWTNQRISLNDSLRSLGQSLEENGKTFSIWSDAGSENVGNLLDVIDELAEKSGGDSKKLANDLVSLRQALVDLGVGSSGLRYVDDAIEAVGESGKVSQREVERFTDALIGIGSAEDEILSVADAIDSVARAAVTGIQGRFAQAFAIDEITLGWLDMQDAAADAADEVANFNDQIADSREQIEDARLAIDEANASIEQLTADRGKLEYQLSVALRYGDLLRAEQIRADIAAVDADIARENDNISDSNRDIADANRDIAEAEQGILDVRTQTTRETIEATRALQDMAVKYAEATAYMLINAEEGADLNKIIDDQVEAFRQNAIQMGYTEEEANAVAEVLREELIKSMEEIPENIRTIIEAETDGALGAVNSFVSDANNRLAQIDRNIVITTTYRTVNAPGTSTGSGGGGRSFAYLATGGLVSGPGTSTSDSIAARLSNGEYVVRASAVEQYGVPFLNALNQQRVTPAMMSAPASSVVSSGGVMSLSPEDRALLRAAIDRPVNLYTDNTVIAKSANAGNQVLAQRGLK
jgi:TP901 family phage tail tape measure protein